MTPLPSHLNAPGGTGCNNGGPATALLKDPGGRQASSHNSILGKQCIHMAYETQALKPPQAITAHSTRAAAAFSTWPTVEDICRAATWSFFSTFVQLCRIDQTASAEIFGRQILQQVVGEDTH